MLTRGDRQAVLWCGRDLARQRAVSIGPVEPDYSRWPWVDRMVELSFNWWLVELR